MNNLRKYVALGALVCILIPGLASAHQPRIVTSTSTEVTDPEVSKAYYGQLTGEPHTFNFESTSSFDLYVNVLVPDSPNQKQDVSAAIIRNDDKNSAVAVLEGINFQWKKYFEPFGHDTYFQGPEFKSHAEAGKYQIIVWSSNNDSKYSLAIGETEAFDLKEGLHAVRVIPELKRNFFNKSPIDFILSPFGWGFILAMYIAAFIFGFLYRLIPRKVAKQSVRGVSKNINKSGRLIRALIGVVLLLLAITTTWNPIILFLSGFAFFEAIFSWCGVYAAIGRNTCPIE